MKRTKEFIKRNIAGEIVLVPSGQTAREFNGMVTLTGTGTSDESCSTTSAVKTSSHRLTITCNRMTSFT